MSRGETRSAVDGMEMREEVKMNGRDDDPWTYYYIAIMLGTLRASYLPNEHVVHCGVYGVLRISQIKQWIETENKNSGVVRRQNRNITKCRGACLHPMCACCL